MAHIRPLLKIATNAVLLLAACAALQAQQPPGSAPDGAARLLNFVGQLSVVRGGYAWALNVGDSIQPQETVVTGPDGWGVFQISDGSKFEVYPNSRVIFRANRNSWIDLLEVFLGKVRVQIEHFGGMPNNNNVRTPTAVISVRGTIFIVEVEPDTNTTLVQDEEGVVVVRHILRPSETTLKPGEYVRVFRNEPIGKAVFDKGGVLQRLARAAQDAFYQAAVNRGSGIPRVGSTTSAPGSPADKNNGGSTAPPPPPAPAPPPPPPH
ncbi:MAG TPA: FecR family protein [Bryobacteraceae bacterium]|nr:FecR family protein [Bryobacteraceae bacterium]